ncbi:hypothetical protein EDD90_2814 [Streptomyces sp. Ag109_O5-1]|uniref:hypothetical protein n=1 Tax=Streptomyces sp. Ag109_O5-1 TaxID=1938851 RepID=UPI000F50407B|nr:hypothetical protein [Streptomyces sp. Ag109_O5-1]RPE39796.1 hypothetical protein EDD90_2814 [Streptomyces sp. Ag109_O5-1]
MSAAPTLAVTDVTTDHAGRVYAVIPDTVARPLALAALEGIAPDARGVFFESVAHPANSWAAATVRTVFEAVLATRPEEHDVCSGLGLYRKYGGGTFYGFIVGASGWDAGTSWWRDYADTGDLRVRGCATIAHASGGTLAGTCTF